MTKTRRTWSMQLAYCPRVILIHVYDTYTNDLGYGIELGFFEYIGDVILFSSVVVLVLTLCCRCDAMVRDGDILFAGIKVPTCVAYFCHFNVFILYKYIYVRA